MSRWRNVHAEDGTEIVELPLLSLSRLYVHRAHQRVEALRERSEALLLHVDALEGMVVYVIHIVEHFAAGAVECRLPAGSHRVLLTEVH